MKKLAARGLVVLGLATSLGFSTVTLASAGGLPGVPPVTGSVTSALKAYHQQLAAYRASLLAIESTFRASVAQAESTYQKALAVATTSAERSVAHQNKVTAIIKAAETRTAALVALGNPPTPPT